MDEHEDRINSRDRTRELDKLNKGRDMKTYSRSHHYKQDKIRGCRRKADRHSHHRRRQIVDESIKKIEKKGLDDEPNIPRSMTCNQKRRPGGLCGSSDASHGCTNKKVNKPINVLSDKSIRGGRPWNYEKLSPLQYSANKNPRGQHVGIIWHDIDD
jgi:hypothetical protein